MQTFKEIKSYHRQICPQRNRSAAFFVPFLLPILLLLLLFPPNNACGQEYRIGEGDLLKITVYENSDLATEARVSGEGKITVPLIGEVAVNGLTAAEIGKKLAGLLTEGYIRNPQVNVFIAEYRSRKVTILGEVAKPGLIELRGNSTLMEVISNAGGITANAGELLFIQRSILKNSHDRKSDITLSVDLTKLLEKGDMASNVPVLDGDSIYVPRASKVTALGEFMRPGLIGLRGKSTLMEVISNAGGVTANAGDTLFIQRTITKGGTNTKNEVTIPINLTKLFEIGDVSLNVPVLDGDSIYMPKAAFVYVNGEVKNPGVYKITRGLTVLRCITLAGGFTQKARKKAEIIRKSDKGEITIAAQMDDLVQPDDIIVVPESFF